MQRKLIILPEHAKFSVNNTGQNVVLALINIECSAKNPDKFIDLAFGHNASSLKIVYAKENCFAWDLHHPENEQMFSKISVAAK